MVTSLEQARMFAATHQPGAGPDRGGDVYRVQPTIPLALDPDCDTEGLSWCASKALIIGIAATAIRRKPYIEALIQAEHARQTGRRWTH